MTKEPLALKIDQLTVNYEKTPVLWEVSLEIPPGKLVGIIGPNGAGKSTLIKAALGLVQPLSGSVRFFGSSFKKMRQKIGYIPQRETVDWDFPITLFDLVMMGRYGHLGLLRRPKKKDREHVHCILQRVGLDNFCDRQISQLSGGQQQRAFFARALIQECDLYFMDEPFAGIDMASAERIIELLAELRSQGKTVFIVHHDLNTVPEIFDWAILLNMRVVASGEVSAVFTPELIGRAYGEDNRILSQVAALSQKISAGIKS